MPQVYVIDDDEGVRRSLSLLMRSVHFDVKTYASARVFLAELDDAQSVLEACIVVDVRMPDMTGLELQAELNARASLLPVIVMSAYADVPLAVRAMQAGAVTLLEKPVDEQKLIDSVTLALQRAGQVAANPQSEALNEMRARLTPRQIEVFDLLIQGYRTREIAERLKLSHRTVDVHRGQILERLAVDTFSQVMGMVLRKSHDG